MLWGVQNSIGIYWGDADWFRKHDFSWFPDDKFKNRNWQFGNPQEYQSLQLTKKLCERVSNTPNKCFSITGQATAVYEAQIKKSNGKEQKNFIVKIFMRIPEIQAKPENGDYVLKEDLIEYNPPIKEELSDNNNNSRSYENEYGILQYLTDSRCKSTPLHITNFERNEANPWTLNGFLCFVIMTKVPGVPVSDIWTESPDRKSVV